jgi:hypothetical protein
MSGATIYDDRAHIGCPAVLTELPLQLGETARYDLSWNQMDDFGQPVPVPADYRIRGYFDSGEPVPDGFATISISP